MVKTIPYLYTMFMTNLQWHLSNAKTRWTKRLSTLGNGIYQTPKYIGKTMNHIGQM